MSAFSRGKWFFASQRRLSSTGVKREHYVTAKELKRKLASLPDDDFAVFRTRVALHVHLDDDSSLSLGPSPGVVGRNPSASCACIRSGDDLVLYVRQLTALKAGVRRGSRDVPTASQAALCAAEEAAWLRTKDLIAINVAGERRRLRIALAAAWATADIMSIQRDKTNELVARLGDEPYDSRKTFAHITPEELADIALAVQVAWKLGANFHRYYFFYKVYELLPMTTAADVNLLFKALLKHDIMLSSNHPIAAKLKDRAVDAMERAREFSFEPVLAYLRHMPLDETQLASLIDSTGEFVKKSTLLWLAFHASLHQTASAKLVKDFGRALDDGRLTIDSAEDCWLATVAVSTKWLPERDKMRLLTLIESTMTLLLDRADLKWTSLEHCTRAALLLAYIGRGSPRLAATVVSHERHSVADPNEPSLRQMAKSLYFSKESRQTAVRLSLRHLSAAAVARWGPVAAPGCLRPMPREAFYINNWKQQEENDTVFAALLDALAGRRVKELAPPHAGLQTRDLLVLDDQGQRAAAVVLFDSRLHARGTHYDLNLFKDLLLVFYAREGIERVHFLDAAEVATRMDHFEVKTSESAIRTVVNRLL